MHRSNQKVNKKFGIYYNFIFSDNDISSMCHTLTQLILTDGLVWFRFMVLNTIFNNISVISWRLFLLVEETEVPGENHQPVASHLQTLSHNVVKVSSTPRHERGSNSQL